MLSAELGTGQLLFWMLWFFLWILWIYLLFHVLADVFRSGDLSGWSKALWMIFVILLPYLGVLVYLVARGRKMHEHATPTAYGQDAPMRQYVQSVTASQARGQ
jgi:Phospholipase_D-nuclease N-terminal